LKNDNHVGVPLNNTNTRYKKPKGLQETEDYFLYVHPEDEEAAVQEVLGDSYSKSKQSTDESDSTYWQGW